MRWTLFLILFLAGPALANGDPVPPADPSAQASSSAAAGAIAVAGAGAIAGATGGAGGAADSTSEATGGAGGQGIGDVSYTTKIPRQLGGIALGAGNNTAVGTKCFSLFGGRASGGSANEAGGILCWKQRDDYWLAEYHRYVDMNLPEQAAAAYCATGLRSKAFGAGERGRGRCEATIAQKVTEHWASIDEEQKRLAAETVPVVRRDWCDERVRRCEAAAVK